jgi:hypothetical protein
MMTLLICLEALPAHAQDGHSIVEIRTTNREQIQQVADLGIDIWQVEGDAVTAYVSPLDRKALLDAGLSFDVQEEDAGAFIRQRIASWEPSALSYHSYATLVPDLYALEASGIAKVYDIGDSLEGRDIVAVRISDLPDVDEGEPAVLLVGCHHAREWISVEVPFLIAQHLVDNYATDPQVRDLVDEGEIWILPMLNPDGHQYSVTRYRLWRKNRRDNGDGSFGVDLNRNYEAGWGGPGSSGATDSEIYRGTAPFSEPETQALRDFFLDPTYDFRAMISYHNYGQLVLYPWGHSYIKAPDNHMLDRIAREMEIRIEAVHGKNYRAGPSNSLYLSSGTAEDWTYDVSGIPSYNIELRPAFFFPGFLLPPAQIQPTADENIPAALYLMGLTQNDDDGDGIVEVEDNCIGIHNPDQEDIDGDGAGAACDCDDTDPAVNPGADELCTNSLDEDCDGLIDGDDPDCLPATEWSVAKNAEASVAQEGGAFTSHVLNAFGPFLFAGFLVAGWKLARRRM